VIRAVDNSVARLIDNADLLVVASDLLRGLICCARARGCAAPTLLNQLVAASRKDEIFLAGTRNHIQVRDHLSAFVRPFANAAKDAPGTIVA
jgi:hypothetical protein